MFALPCCGCCGSVDCDGEGAEVASVTRSEGYPLVSTDTVRGAAGNMPVADLVSVGGGRLRPWGGDRRRGILRLLKAAEMRQKTLGSAAGGGGRHTELGVGEEGESRGAGGSPPFLGAPPRQRHGDCGLAMAASPRAGAQ